MYKEASFHYSMAVKQKAYRNFHEKVFEIIEFESFGTIETSKGFQHKVHKRISKGIVLVAAPHLSPGFFPPGTLFSHFFLPADISP